VIATSLVLQNLSYLIGAVALAVVIGVAVALRHRKPKSLEANVESFNKGLRALSPGGAPTKRRRRPSPAGQAIAARAVTPLAREPALPSRSDEETGAG
jgi:hypothetical protein